MSRLWPGMWAIVLALVLVAPAAASGQVTVAAAADLQTVMPEITARFERATGQTVRVSYGSSGQFVSQIQNGAPFDLFLSADDQYVRRLVAAGFGDPATVTSYATGRLALWTRKDRAIDISAGLASVAAPQVHRIAIANPTHAPYGRAAVEALQRAGLYDRVRTRLVLGENVSQAAQFAQTGNADVGLVALSLTLSPAMRDSGTSVEIPQSAFPRIRQTGVVVSRSTHAEVARRLLAFMRQPDIAALLQASGFGAQP